MKRALMVAATLLAAGGGVDAQSNREQFIYWWDWQDGTFWSRTERWVPPAGNPEAVRCVLQNRQTGMTWDGIAYLPGSAPPPLVLPPLRVETVTVGGAVFVVSGRDLVIDTIAMPAPPDTIAPPDTVPPVPPDTVPLPPDTTIVGRLAASWEAHTWGADVIVQLADSAAGVDVTFSPSGGFMGPPTAPIVGEWTRQTGATGQIGVGWRSYSATDTMTIRSGRDTLRIGVPVDTTTPPPPAPPIPLPPPVADSTDVTPAAAHATAGPLIVRQATSGPVAALDSRYAGPEQSTYDTWVAGGRSGADGSSHYGALRSRFQWCVRNGLALQSCPAYTHGVEMTRAMILKYTQPNDFHIPPHNNTAMPDVELLYVLEGDAAALAHLNGIALHYGRDVLDYYFDLTGANSDPRSSAILLQTLNAAARHNLPFVARRWGNTWIEAADHMVGRMAAQIPASGVVVSLAHKNSGQGDEAFFMNAMLATELLRWHGYVAPQPTWVSLAQRIMDHLIDEHMRRGVPCLPYLSRGTGCAPDLASFYVWPALVLWQETGDTKYRDFALSNLDAARGAYIAQAKIFNQTFSTAAQSAEALLSGVRWR